MKTENAILASVILVGVPLLTWFTFKYKLREAERIDQILRERKLREQELEKQELRERKLMEQQREEQNVRRTEPMRIAGKVEWDSQLGFEVLSARLLATPDQMDTVIARGLEQAVIADGPANGATLKVTMEFLMRDC